MAQRIVIQKDLDFPGVCFLNKHVNMFQVHIFSFYAVIKKLHPRVFFFLFVLFCFRIILNVKKMYFFELTAEFLKG